MSNSSHALQSALRSGSAPKKRNSGTAFIPAAYQRSGAPNMAAFFAMSGSAANQSWTNARTPSESEIESSRFLSPPIPFFSTSFARSPR